MFLRRTRGLLDFIAVAFCLWAAWYHTPAGALVRGLGARLTGQRNTAGPLLSYFSGGGEAFVPTVAPPASSRADALANGVYAVLHARSRASSVEAVERSLDAAERTFLGPDLAALSLFVGEEPARYAAGRVAAAGLEPTLENAARALPPGFEGQVADASQALTLATAYALAWPIGPAPVTSPFGPRVDPVTGRPHVHTGVDLGVPFGTAVHAPGDGVVRRASEDPVCGQLVVIDHGHGVTTAYCHNSQLKVSAGDKVSRGDLIAWSGSTGRSTGPHLHYQVELWDRPVDPFSFKRRSETLTAGGSL